MKQGLSEQVLRTLGRITEVADFSKIVVSEQNDKPVMVSDIAKVEDGIKEPRSLSRWDGKNAVSLVIRKQSGTNTIEVVDSIFARLQELESALPPGVDVIASRDSSRVHPRVSAYGAGASGAGRHLRRDRGVLLPRLVAFDTDCGGRDSGFDRLDLHAAFVDGLHAQHAVAAGADTRGRHRHR